MRADFAYQAEKLNQARSILMAPHPRGEATSFAAAFEVCSRALDDLDRTPHSKELVEADPNAKAWLETIRVTMDTTGLSDPGGEGLWLVKARKIRETKKRAFSRAIDELAHWFDRHFWEAHL